MFFADSQQLSRRSALRVLCVSFEKSDTGSLSAAAGTMDLSAVALPYGNKPRTARPEIVKVLSRSAKTTPTLGILCTMGLYSLLCHFCKEDFPKKYSGITINIAANFHSAVAAFNDRPRSTDVMQACPRGTRFASGRVRDVGYRPDCK